MNKERKLYEDWLHKSPEFGETIISAWDVWLGRAALAQPEPAAPTVVEHSEQWWLHRIDMEKTQAWQQGYAQGLHRAATPPRAAPTDPLVGMSEINRTVAYCAAAKLRELGYDWTGAEWAAPTVVEPVGWLEAPYGGFKSNPLYRMTLPPAALAWKIPLYTTPPRAALTVDEAIHALSSALAESKGWLRDYSDAVIRDAIDRTDA